MHVLVGRIDQRRIDLQPLRQCGAEPLRVRGSRGIDILGRLPAGKDRATPVRRPGANARRAPSAAVARPDSACRKRSAVRTQVPSARAAAASACSAKRCLVGPSASVVHSGSSKSLAATKVGSPPMVSRTLPAASARSTAAPIARMSCHCASLYGLVTRGVSRTRVRRMSKPNSVSHGSDQPGDRRGGLRIGRGGERDMALAGQQTGRGVHAHPAGARQIRLRPGMQVGEVGGRAFRPFKRLHIADKLDQVAGDEARRIAEMAQQLHQQPRRIAAGAFARRQRLLRASRRPAPCGRCRRRGSAPRG